MDSTAGGQEGKRTRQYIAAWLLCATLVISGCGGSGGSVAGTASPTTLRGVVASGGPVAAARVSAIDNSGSVVAMATSGVDGSYSLPLPAGTTPPLLNGRQRLGRLAMLGDNVVERREFLSQCDEQVLRKLAR